VLARVAAGAAAGSIATLGASGTAAKVALVPLSVLKWVSVLGVAGAVGVGVGTIHYRAQTAPVTSGAASPAAHGHDKLAGPRALTRSTAGASPNAVEVGTPAIAVPAVTPGPAAGNPEAPADLATTPPPSAFGGRSAATPPPMVPGAPCRTAAVPCETRSPASPAGGSLEAETGLLEAAQSELRAGHPERALSALDEHGRKYRDGVLSEERLASRVLALCALGRTDEARSEAQRFLSTSPRSPMAERVRSSCGGTSP
jgi:hypothetical protein